MGKLIAFRGIEFADLLYYIAKSLASNNNSIAIIDNSYSKDLYESVNHYDENLDECVVKETIAYFKNKDITSEFIDKFDFVFIYEGMCVREKYEYDLSFIQANYSNIVLESISLINEEIRKKSYFILRDKFNYNISENNIARRLTLNPEQVLGCVTFDLKNATSYQNFTYNGRARVNKISNEMKYSVLTCLAIITECTEKEAKKYFKKAKKNKRI